MLLRPLLILVTLIPCLICGRIYETGDIGELKKYVAPGTLFICDLDNTLIEPAQMLGSVYWAEHYLYEQYKRLGLSNEDIYKFGLNKWSLVQARIPVRLVDPGMLCSMN